MTFRPSPHALERPRHTIQAAEVFHDHARAIAAACAEAAASEAVLAIVDADFRFEGVWLFPLRELRRQIPLLEPEGGWSMTFAAGADLGHIEEQCLRLARSSFRRWEALRYWVSKHPRDSDGP